MSDSILHVLADNGKHFTHLAPEERITIAVTFRGQAPTDGCCWNYSRPTRTGNQGGNEQAKPPSQPGQPGDPDPDQAAYLRALQEAVIRRGTPEMDNWLNLGDLHYRQAKYAEALQAYGKVADARQKAYAEAVTGNKFTPHGKALALLDLADLFTRMAQCQLAQGNREPGNKALEMAARASCATPKSSPTGREGLNPEGRNGLASSAGDLGAQAASRSGRCGPDRLRPVPQRGKNRLPHLPGSPGEQMKWGAHGWAHTPLETSPPGSSLPLSPGVVRRRKGCVATAGPFTS